MSGIVDVVMLILFVGFLIVIIGGFNRQMVEQNRERKRKSEERLNKIDKNKKEDKKDD